MILDLNKQLKKLDGTEYEGEGYNMGKMLAHALSQQGEGDEIKLMDWARALYNGDSINIDRGDKNLLINIINKSFVAIAKEQMKEVLNHE